MTEISDKELNTIRLRILDLIKSFFTGEPDLEKVETWKEVVSTLMNEQINPEMDAAVVKLESILNGMSLEELQSEYYELYTNPFSPNTVHSTLSYYADGHDFGQSLVDLRRFLVSAEISPLEELDESEDSLVFLLDVYTTLIRDEEDDPAKAKTKESELLTQYIEPLTIHLNSALQDNKKANFFRACAGFLSGYVGLEKGLVV